MALKLYIGNKNYSSWSLRGWIACKQSGLPFEEEVVPLYHDDWTTRRTSPEFAPGNGLVPILWDGDTPIWDSLAILNYLDHKTGGHPLLACSARRPRTGAFDDCRNAQQLWRIAVRAWMNVRRKYPAAPPSAAAAADIERILQLWLAARSRFGGAGDFLFGDFGAADIMFAPVVTRFVTYAFEMPRFAQSYIDAVTAHPFMQDWLAAAHEEDWVIEKFERPVPA